MKKTLKKCVRTILVLFFVTAIFIVSSAAAYEEPKKVIIEDVKLDALYGGMFVDYSLFYYNQLTDIEKEIYNIFLNSKESFIKNEGIYCMTGLVSDVDNCFNQIKKIMSAFCYDNPESTIYLNHYMLKAISSEIKGMEYYDFYVKPSIKTKTYSNSNEKEMRKKLEIVEKVTKEFVQTLSGSNTDKLAQIHDWLITDSVYDMTMSLQDTANIYGAIVNKECICAGYANAFKYIADMANLNVIYVTGNSFSNGTIEYHAWNLVYIDGEWKLVDVTWDLAFLQESPHRFFLILPEEEKQNGTAHVPEREIFVYPK